MKKLENLGKELLVLFTKLRKKTALKVIFVKNNIQLQEVEREVEILRGLQHKNIVKFIDCKLVTSNDNSMFEIKRMTNYVAATIVMELCDHSLADELKSRHQVELDESFKIFKQIIDGGQHLHLNKIIHRDLKPANILIQSETIKISDFGLSKYVPNHLAIQHSGIKGTPGYRAPEQQDPSVTYNYKVDIFSLGIILAELYTNKSVTEWLPDFWDKNILPPLLGNYVESLVKDMTNIDPTKRPEITEIVNRITPQPKRRPP